jgi:FtsP/CotA-like multicopper oxidase with cupredoxin domain
METTKHKVHKKRRLALFIPLALLVVAGSGFYYWQTHKVTNLSGHGVPKNLATAKSQQEISLKNGEVYNLKASFVMNDLNGVKQPMLAYGESIPGPTFRVKQGDKVTVNFENDINMDTTIHAHGLRQDVKMDGTPTMSQDPVKVGDTFKYEWSSPDPGVYWYHPHIREDFQQGSGMYGAIVVEPKTADYWPAADSDQTLILADALIDENGLLVPFNDKADHTLMGRYGNVMLINGKTNWQTEVKAYTVQRFYIANASSARPYRFALNGVKMKVVGSDNGRVGNERFVDALTLSPGERYIVDVVFDKTGAVAIKNNAPSVLTTIGTVNVTKNEVPSASVSSYATLRTNKDVVDEIANLASKVVVSKRLSLDMTMDMGSMSGSMSGGHMMSDGSMMGGGTTSTHMMADGTMMDSNGNTVDPETAGIEWTDTGMSATGVKWKITDQDTNKSNDAVKWSFNKGDVVRITIKNDSNSMHPMQHPIHLHGQRFAVVSKNGKANTNIEWKDTMTIPSGQTYELLVVMDNPGEWMLHCHIAEHLETGMAITFEVKN